MIPQDPVMLASWLNTKLRDESDSLEALCSEYDLDGAELEKKLEQAGFSYDREKNQFR